MSPSVPQDTSKRRGWIWLLVSGIATTIIGIIVGSQKTGSLCGSVFKPDSLAAELYDTMGGYGGAAECRRNIASAAVPIWILIVLGIVLVLTGIIVRAIGKNRPAAVPTHAPSAASQLEDLVRLHRQGLISPEEFETKRLNSSTGCNARSWPRKSYRHKLPSATFGIPFETRKLLSIPRIYRPGVWLLFGNGD